MNKTWRVVSAIALLCLIIGIVGIGVGFFTGSSPVVIQNHGNLAEYMHRLEINRGVLMQDVNELLSGFGRQLPW